MNGFLNGVRVLEMGALTAGPLCARLMANMGAEVIKIEQPGIGELGRRHGSKEEAKGYFETQNYNKKSIGLNMATPQGREIMEKLLGVSDIVIQNLAPQAMEKWGLAPEEACARHPHLIYCSINGFGRNGPLKDKRALDTILQSLSGVASLTGDAQGPPLKSGVSAADASGAVAAVGAMFAALIYRNRTGRGQSIDMSMLDVMGWMTMEAWPSVVSGAGTAPRMGNASLEAAPQNSYQCRDGYLAISVQNDGQWKRFQQLLDEAGQNPWREIVTLQDRLSHREQIDQDISRWALPQSALELETQLQKKAVPAVKVLEVHEVLADPQIIAREMVIGLQDQNGDRVRVLGFPVKSSESQLQANAPAPLAGEHNDEIYHDLLGLSRRDLAELSREGII
jgi:formyl-CoA transferase/CoA:oxalate CoA-transferase